MKELHPVFHISVLKEHAPDLIPGHFQDPPGPIEVEVEDEWEVEEVLDARLKRLTREYLVSWRGYGPQHNLWEPERNVTNCREMVQEANTQFPEAVNVGD
jgi:hypothetical protein